MLVIRRRLGESVLIGDDIEIEVLELGTSQIKLGISAPKAIPVVRREIAVVGAQNRAAARQIPTANLEKVVSVLRNSSSNPSTLR